MEKKRMFQIEKNKRKNNERKNVNKKGVKKLKDGKKNSKKHFF